MVKREVDGLTLRHRQVFQDAQDQPPRVGMLDIILGRIVDPGFRLLFGLVLQTFLGPCVGLFLAQPVDGAAAGQRDDPAQRLAFCAE